MIERTLGCKVNELRQGREAGIIMRMTSLMILACSAVAVHGAVDEIWPGSEWERSRPEQVGMDMNVLQKARDYALTGGGSGCITRHGRLIMQWGDQKQRYDLKSSTKAIGVTALGLALKDRKIGSLQDVAKKYHPDLGIPPESNAGTGSIRSHFLTWRPRPLVSIRVVDIPNCCLNLGRNGHTVMAGRTGWPNVSLWSTGKTSIR